MQPATYGPKSSYGDRIRGALMLDPPVLLLDEPMAALDPIIRADLQADLKAIFRKLHKTVILVTHDPGIGASAPRLVRMRDGVVVSDDRQEGTPAVSIDADGG